MSAEAILSRLERVRKTGQGRWISACPSHNDHRPSLSLRELDDGRVLVHCFAGCDVSSVVGAVGLSLEDLFPPREVGTVPGSHRPFPVTDVFRCVSFEAMIVAIAALRMARGVVLSNGARERLLVSASRLQAAADIANV